MKKLLEAFVGVNGEVSSKRLVGILGALTLFASMIIYHTSELIDAVKWVVILALGFTSIEKFKSENKSSSI
jgi:hypothetical protein